MLAKIVFFHSTNRIVEILYTIERLSNCQMREHPTAEWQTVNATKFAHEWNDGGEQKSELL